MLVNIILKAPDIQKYSIYPEVIQGLGRCMMTRRECPDGALWRVGLEGFNQVVLHDISRLSITDKLDPSTSRPARIRIWKEVADVYEIFLVGYCGRALAANSLSTVTINSDEQLEMSTLNILGDKILKSEIDVSADILQRLVSTIDRCASRTCSLPLETVELLPSHCCKFSLTCLQKLFTLTSYDDELDDLGPTRREVCKITIMVLMGRCQDIFNQFLMDEGNLGQKPLPTARLEEVIHVIQELARLIIHSDTASVLPLHPYLISGTTKEGNQEKRTHLFVLYQSFCELVVSREARVRELVQVLLRLVGEELGIQKLQLAKS